MPLYTPDGGATDPEWRDLDRKLREGDGIQWPGDPRLWLGIGTLKNNATGKTGRRLEVWRDNEDGSTTLISHWLPTDQYRVLYDLARMRVDAPGHEDTVDKIERDNAALEKERDDAAAEELLEQLDHAIRLHVEKHNPRTRFYMHGDRAGRA